MWTPSIPLQIFTPPPFLTEIKRAHCIRRSLYFFAITKMYVQFTILALIQQPHLMIYILQFIGLFLAKMALSA